MIKLNGRAKKNCQYSPTLVRTENILIIDISWERFLLLDKLSHLLVSFQN